jgi:ribonucleotide reductase alpha subunit
MGLQDVATTLIRLGIPYEKSGKLQAFLAEFIYYYALNYSCDYAKEYNKVYKKFDGSPYSKGILHFDLFDKHFKRQYPLTMDWDTMREKVKGGLANSLLIAHMPNVSTSMLSGCRETSEPITKVLLPRKVMVGELMQYDKDLDDLIDKISRKKGISRSSIYADIYSNDASIMNVKHIPYVDKLLFKNVYEIKLRDYINCRAAIQPFVDQGISMNLYIDDHSDNSYNKLYSAYIHSYKMGLKTGCYYLRKPAKGKHLDVACENCSG